MSINSKLAKYKSARNNYMFQEDLETTQSAKIISILNDSMNEVFAILKYNAKSIQYNFDHKNTNIDSFFSKKNQMKFNALTEWWNNIKRKSKSVAKQINEAIIEAIKDELPKEYLPKASISLDMFLKYLNF